jgi:6-pyruvoyltetrahydropterin/6-carboxytetrahydropterin synthase
MSRYTIYKSFRFEAAHHLTGLPDGHQCGRQHGHSYRVTVILEADELVIPGFVADFGDLKPVKRWVDTVMDHQDLNEVLPEWWTRAGLDADTAPTSEHLAELVYTVIKVP